MIDSHAPAKPEALKLLVVIVDRPVTKKVVEILYEEQVRFHFISLAEGTAGTDIMALLGLESRDKSFICCLHLESRMPLLLSRIAERLQLHKPGKGIAFIMPTNGVNNAVLQLLSKDAEQFPASEEDKKMEDKSNTCAPAKYDLILSIVNQGHVDTLMNAAKSAGARGGTVLHGRKMGVEEDVKFFGISIQIEKDIVAILTVHEQKNDIMRAITQTCGMSTEARGIVISLPVDDIEGLGQIKDTLAEAERESAQ